MVLGDNEIEQGKAELEAVLSAFYRDFAVALQVAQDKIDKESVEIPPDVSPFTCEKCGSPMVYKLGRFGKFLACQNYPDCRNTKTIDKEGNPVNKEKEAPEKADFTCPECGGEVVLRRGRYGSFYACANYPKCSYTKQKTEKLSVLCGISQAEFS